MSQISPALLQSMQYASALLQKGDFVPARALLEQVLIGDPHYVEAHRLLAGALQALGDEEGAIRTLHTAVAIEPRWAPAQTSLAELLLRQDKNAEAEVALRTAVASGRHHLRAATILAQLLNDANRSREALDLCVSFALSAKPDLDLLTQQATALARLERYEEAIVLYRRIVEAGGNALAEFNLGAALEGAGHHFEAEAAVRGAIDKGANLPEADYVHGSSLTALGRFDEAEAALLRAIGKNALYAEAQRSLAQLIWMRGGDIDAACEHLEAALRAHPEASTLRVVKAGLLDGAGDARGAYECLAESTQDPAAGVNALLKASLLALKFDPALAREHAQRALAIAPGHPPARLMVAHSLLASGSADQAERILAELLKATPDSQGLISLLTTAWRLLGDPRQAAWCDYPSMARGWVLETPRGWSTLGSYLRDLAASLHGLHRLRAHPLHQSLRHGSQTTQKNLLATDDPVVRAFSEAIDGPIRRHLQELGKGSDPLRRRLAGGYRIKGIWSVRLRGKGFHVNHNHPEGWISSACYIELPRVMATNGSYGPDSSRIVPAGPDYENAGWLKFGEPGTPTSPVLGPEAYIRPEPGLLALFPSYFWHGTVPFEGDDTRLTIAFDLVPAD